MEKKSECGNSESTPQSGLCNEKLCFWKTVSLSSVVLTKHGEKRRLYNCTYKNKGFDQTPEADENGGGVTHARTPFAKNTVFITPTHIQTLSFKV